MTQPGEGVSEENGAHRRICELKWARQAALRYGVDGSLLSVPELHESIECNPDCPGMQASSNRILGFKLPHMFDTKVCPQEASTLSREIPDELIDATLVDLVEVSPVEQPSLS